MVTSSRLAALALPLVGLLVPLGACRPATTARVPEPVKSTDAPAPETGVLGTRAGEPPHGVLDKNDIRNVVRGHIGDVRTCYNRGLARDPALTGRVMIQFSIGSNGTVTESAVQSSELPQQADDVARCIAGAAKNWRFPAPEGGGSVIVSYPFVLEPWQAARSRSGLVAGEVGAGQWFAVEGFPSGSLVVEVVAQGAAVQGVPVQLKVRTSEGESVRTAVSDARGRVVFSECPPSGSAFAVIEYAPGRLVGSESVTLGSGSQGTILVLKPVAPAAK